MNFLKSNRDSEICGTISNKHLIRVPERDDRMGKRNILRDKD